MQKKIKPFALTGMTLTTLLTVTDSSHANDVLEGTNLNTISDRDKKREENIQPEEEIILPTDESHITEESSSLARTPEEADTIEFSEGDGQPSDRHSPSPATPPESFRIPEQFPTPARTLEEAPWLLDATTVEFSEDDEQPGDRNALSQGTSPETTPIGESLKVLPRMEVTFQSGPEAGYGSSFGSAYAFVPFGQTPGFSTFYTEGRLNFLTHDSDFGGNLRLGYRTLLPDSDLVLGGYIGADLRRTEFDETFYQFGFGVDLQGNKWEVSANAYIPLGSRQREVANDVYDSGLIISNFGFSGNNLTFSRFRQQTTSRLLETSMMGFDLEGGYQIASWETGNLYAYGGMYFLDAPGSSSVVGVRGRVQAEIDNFQAGLALQSDGIFGTNLTFNVGIIFGGNATRKKDETPEETAIARLGRGVRRQEIIAVDRENEVTTTIEQADNETALNPTTGEAWRFLHVTGGASGDCTFENPCGQVTEAMTLAQTLGNDIIYVDSGTNPGMNGFSILDNVQVLSTAYERFLDYQITGDTTILNTQLPGSGTGVLPLINGTTVTVSGNTAMVSMGNNSILSGFDIQSGNSDGILGLNVGEWTIDRNQVTTTGNNADGILAYANSGTINTSTISGNSISTSGDSALGIAARTNNNGTISAATISDNSISTLGASAAAVSAYANSGTISGAIISGNSASTSGDSALGIAARTNNNGTISAATLSGNSISTLGASADAISAYVNSGTISGAIISSNSASTSGNFADGIVTHANGGTISNATISGNSISTAGDDANGIFAQTSNNGTIDTTTISGNTTSTSGIYAHGLSVYGNSGTISNATVSGNSASTSGNYANGILTSARNGGTLSNAMISGNSASTSGAYANGIYIDANNGTVDSSTISGNFFSTSGNNANGIYITPYNGGTISNATVSGNTISASGGVADGIFAYTYTGTISNATIANNIIQQAGQHSTRLQTGNAGDNICIAQFTGNTSSMPGAAGDDLNITIFAGTIDFVDFANVFANNTGFDDIVGAPTTTPASCP